VGAILSEQHRFPSKGSLCSTCSRAGHPGRWRTYSIQDKTKRSFEVSAIVYPESLKVVDQHHREIINKSCALSAKDDELETMKRYVFNAAHQQG